MKETVRRKRFFKIALQLINKKGYKAMTMRDLAQALDCDVSNIYNYVKSKHTLLETLLFEISNKFHDGMSAIDAATSDPIEKIKAVIALHIRLTVEHPHQVVLLVNEWRHLKSERQKDFVDFRKDYEEKLKRIIEGGIRAGVLQGGNVEFTTNCFLSSIRWLYSWYSPSKTDMNSEDLERLMTNFILNGITKNRSN